MWRGFRTANIAFGITGGNAPRSGGDLAFRDPEFRAEFQKLVSDDLSPLMPKKWRTLFAKGPAIPRY
jgi:hypothetical protein